jgi:hypothetical protein
MYFCKMEEESDARKRLEKSDRQILFLTASGQKL